MRFCSSLIVLRSVRYSFLQSISHWIPFSISCQGSMKLFVLACVNFFPPVLSFTPTESLAEKPRIYPRRQSMMAGQLFCWFHLEIDAGPGLTLQNRSQTGINESVMRSEAAVASESRRKRLHTQRCDLTRSAYIRGVRSGYQYKPFKKKMFMKFRMI